MHKDLDTEISSQENPASPSWISLEEKEIFPPIVENIREWPIHKLTEDREAFVSELETYTFNNLRRKSTEFLKTLIEKTVFQEKIRIKEDPWRIDPPNDRQFWNRIRKKISEEQSSEDEENTVNETLKMVIHRYAEEIVGTFNEKTYLLIRKVLTSLFKRLLNKGIGFMGWWGNKKVLLDKLKIYGQIEQIRNIARNGTVIILPTHSSNLDSILIGYTTDFKLGLPGPAYGAGLNLYNFGPAAYFMNRLGAYRVDRRKKNAIYLATLSGMSKLAIQKNTNSLFFPGGTRSRSGHLESNLKLGLLSTVIEAQRSIFLEGRKDKIFVVPLVLSYHFVLESKSLIEDYLKKTGKEKYVSPRNELLSIRSWIKFLFQFVTTSSDISLSFGKPMDCFGNFVDNNGNSLDERGNHITIQEYFTMQGKITTNLQRESEYTKNLGQKIAERYKAENIILSSHLVAFVAFQSLKQSNNTLDLFGILRLPQDEYYFSREQFLKQTEVVIEVLKVKAETGLLKLPEIFGLSIEEIVIDGITKIRSYHSSKPLTIAKNNDFQSEDFRLLYFYNNRLDSYDFAMTINWDAYPVVYQID